jgi:hypothetical protein
MSSEKFIKNNTALVTLIAACGVVLISLGYNRHYISWDQANFWNVLF